MKRLILAILSLLYLSTAIGARLHFHYCMGELASWGLAYNKDKECGKCGMEKKAADDDGCCKDELKHVKLKVDQKSPKTVIYQFHVKAESLQPFIIFFPDLVKRQTYFSYLKLNPPRSYYLPTYLRNCNFRI